MGSTSIQVGTKTNINALILEPDVVLHELSIKLFQRRETIINKMINTRISYDSANGMRTGILERVEDMYGIVRDGNHLNKVHLKRIIARKA